MSIGRPSGLTRSGDERAGMADEDDVSLRVSVTVRGPDGRERTASAARRTAGADRARPPDSRGGESSGERIRDRIERREGERRPTGRDRRADRGGAPSDERRGLERLPDRGGAAAGEGGSAGDADVPRSQARFEVYEDRSGRWRWRLKHRNGNVIADGGQGYASRASAERGLESVRRNAPGAPVRRVSDSPSEGEDDGDGSGNGGGDGTE